MMEYTESEIHPVHPQMFTSLQLIAYMKQKGITFQYTSEEEALAFLQDKNYYLKLTSYRKNYRKCPSGENTGKYLHLDFAYLQELSYIDMELRYLIIHMCLDIEHYLKVALLNSIENNPKEDGYHIINLFLSGHESVLGRIQAHNNNSYSKDLIEKYVTDKEHFLDPGNQEYNIPVWVFVELISFGDFTSLCGEYSSEYKIKIGSHIFLNSVRDLRNACAHSNCLINDLHPDNGLKVPGEIFDCVNKLDKFQKISKETRRKKLHNPFLRDFVCLIFTYFDVVTDTDKKEETLRKMADLFTDPAGKMLRHADWFKDNTLLTSSYDFCKKILDSLTS